MHHDLSEISLHYIIIPGRSYIIYMIIDSDGMIIFIILLLSFVFNGKVLLNNIF